MNEYRLVGTLSNNTNSLIGTITITSGEEGGDYPIYDGDVIVKPQTDADVILPTKKTRLKSDITVEKIPTFETSNVYGTTFIIGV